MMNIKPVEHKMVEVKATELEAGYPTECGFVVEVVYVSDGEVVVNMVEDFDGTYDATDDETFEQFEFEPDDVVLVKE